jgi:DNA anti-recombination protein RmuC
VDGSELKLGQGRLAASQAFEKNRELIGEVKEHIEAVTRTDGEARISAILREYVDGLVKQISERGVDPVVKEQVEREVEEIERHLEEMTKLR